MSLADVLMSVCLPESGILSNEDELVEKRVTIFYH